VVVLAGYKTVKEALVNYAEEFGDRDTMQITKEISNGHGKESNICLHKIFSLFVKTADWAVGNNLTKYDAAINFVAT